MLSKFKITTLGIAGIVGLMASNLYAEESIKIDAVRNELLRASLPRTNQADQEKQVSESDLERATRKLKAAEERLLEQAAQKPVSPRLPGDMANEKSKPIAPIDDSSSEKTAVIKEKNLPNDRASVDLDRVMHAIDSNPVSPPIDAAALLETKPETPANLSDAELIKRNQALESDLQASQAKVNSLLKELDDTRNRLMIAETQVERLSSIIETQNRPGRDQAAGNGSSNTRPSYQSNAGSKSTREKTTDDMQVATVTADKVHLRTGPGKDNSPLMAVTKGTRLAVETRKGDWYRVVAPSGVRAWVSADVVAFGLPVHSSTSQTSRVKGFSNEVESDGVFEVPNKGGSR